MCMLYLVMLVVLCLHSVDCTQSKCALLENKVILCETSLSEVLVTFPKAEELQKQRLTEVGLHHIL